MADDRNLRSVILVLLKRFGQTRSNLMAARMAIEAISNMSSDQRATLTAAQIKAELKSVEGQLAQQPDPAQLEIEKVVAGNSAFENDLAKFVANLRW